MSKTKEQLIEDVYTSLQNNNENIDEIIVQLKAAVAPSKEVVFEAQKLVQPNREGRKLMQAYFKKRGLIISFT